MNLSKENTKTLQGMAILFMFGLHLFNRTDTVSYYDVFLWVGERPLLTLVSYVFDAVVPIYLFCSGYGLYIRENENQITFKMRFRRIMKLLFRYWIILVITCVVGYCLGMRETYPGTWWNFLLNVFLIRLNYVGAFWFVQIYTLLVLLSGMFSRMVRRNYYISVSVGSAVLYTMSFIIYYTAEGGHTT